MAVAVTYFSVCSRHVEMWFINKEIKKHALEQRCACFYNYPNNANRSFAIDKNKPE